MHNNVHTDIWELSPSEFFSYREIVKILDKRMKSYPLDHYGYTRDAAWLRRKVKKSIKKIHWDTPLDQILLDSIPKIIDSLVSKAERSWRNHI